MRTTILASLTFASLTACTATTAPTTVPADDELAGESGDGEAPKADGYDTFGIYTAQKIGAFECNGAGSCTHVELARANRSTTTCADGKPAASCEVRTLDFSNLGLAADKLALVTGKLQASAATPELGPQLLVRGKYVHGTNPTVQGADWVTFQVSEVWVAQLDHGTLDGTFVMLRDSNIRCITAPCPATAEGRVNSSKAMNIDGMDWSATDTTSALSADPEGDALAATSEPDGLIVNGTRTHAASGPAATYRAVGQSFLRVK